MSINNVPSLLSQAYNPPNEIWLKIFNENLSPEDRLNFSFVCKHFNWLAGDSKLFLAERTYCREVWQGMKKLQKMVLSRLDDINLNTQHIEHLVSKIDQRISPGCSRMLQETIDRAPKSPRILPFIAFAQHALGNQNGVSTTLAEVKPSERNYTKLIERAYTTGDIELGDSLRNAISSLPPSIMAKWLRLRAVAAYNSAQSEEAYQEFLNYILETEGVIVHRHLERYQQAIGKTEIDPQGQKKRRIEDAEKNNYLVAIFKEIKPEEFIQIYGSEEYEARFYPSFKQNALNETGLRPSNKRIKRQRNIHTQLLIEAGRSELDDSKIESLMKAYDQNLKEMESAKQYDWERALIPIKAQLATRRAAD